MPLRGIGEKTRKETGKHGWALISGKRGPDKRSDLTRKRRRIRTCKVPTCTFIARRGWRKGFCIRHAKTQGFQDPNPKRSHHAKKLKVKDVMRKLKLKLKVKLKLKLKKATSQFPPGGQTPEKLINAKKQKKLTTNEKELTKEEVEAKNLEIRLLEPVAGFAKAAMDSDTEAEFFQAPAGDLRRLEELRAEWMDSDDEWECGWWMVCRRRGLDDLEQLNLDLCEEDFQKRRKPEPLVPAWQWFDNETEQLDCAHDLDQAMVESRPDQEAAVRRQDEEFDDVDFCWPSPPRGRLVWDED
jgi:hypothetical protein